MNTATLALRRSLSPVKSPQTYRTMDKYGGDYMHGPVNGSLYATVSRNQQQTQRSTSQTSERNVMVPGMFVQSCPSVSFFSSNNYSI